MTGKWTPGPWVVANDSDAVFSDGGNLICQCFGSYRLNTVHQMSSNANLLAAAPDLYAALDGLLKVFVEDLWNGGYDKNDIAHNDGVKAARAAIAKARGETL